LSRQPFPRAGVNLVWVDETDSTNALAVRVLDALTREDSVLPDTVFVAASQRVGRGREGRTWISPRGGLYATLARQVPNAALGLVPLAAGVALAEAIEVAGGVAVGLKWPNDVRAGDGKLAGVLCQGRSGESESWTIVGWGVNIASCAELEACRPPAASLEGLGVAGDGTELAWAIVSGVVDRLDGLLVEPAQTYRRWHDKATHREGDLLSVRIGQREVRGVYAGLGPAGELLLRTPTGTESCFAGDVVEEIAGERS